MPLGAEYRSKSGVQSTAQFADLIPQFIGRRVAEMISDSSYIFAVHPDTLVSGKSRLVIDGAKRGNGYDVMRFSYIFDKETLHPVQT